MLEYTRIEPLMEIRAAGNNVLLALAGSVLLLVVRDTDDFLRTIILLIVLVPGVKRCLLSSSVTTQKGVQTIIENNGSSIDLEAFSVQLIRFNHMDHLNLMIAKKN